MLRTLVTTAVAALALTGCAGSAGSTESSGGPTVVTSFYPLQYVTERIAGPRADVVSLTPPGAEPHDLELTPRDVATIADSDLVVLVRGFQPAVDTAVEQQAPDQELDVSQTARLEVFGGPADSGPADEGEDGGDVIQGLDPHFWLDPLRLADVAGAVADRLSALDPDGAAEYDANLEALQADLESLDADISAGLETCASRDLVVSHEAFGYLASRFALHQVGISGLSPEGEPSALTLAEVTDFVTNQGVTTIFSEVLVDPGVARTVAQETGAELAVLDPVEGITDDSAGDDYLEVMRANLDALRTGLGCS